MLQSVCLSVGSFDVCRSCTRTLYYPTPETITVDCHLVLFVVPSMRMVCRDILLFSGISWGLPFCLLTYRYRPCTEHTGYIRRLPAVRNKADGVLSLRASKADGVLSLRASKASCCCQSPRLSCCRWLKVKFRVSVKVGPSLLVCAT